MKTKILKTNEQARKALAGRKIIAIDLHQVREEDGSMSSGYPVFTLDDGSQISFGVVDYGSGTYGIDLLVHK